MTKKSHTLLKKERVVVEQGSDLICICMAFLVRFCLYSWRVGLSVGQLLLKKGTPAFGLESWNPTDTLNSLKSAQINNCSSSNISNYCLVYIRSALAAGSSIFSFLPFFSNYCTLIVWIIWTNSRVENHIQLGMTLTPLVP